MKTFLVTCGTGLVGNRIKNISDKYIDKFNFIYISSKDFNLSIMDETIKMFEQYSP